MLTTNRQQRTTASRRPVHYPAYNEGAWVSATLLLAYVAERGWNAEVVAVKDGSSDSIIAVHETTGLVRQTLLQPI